MPPNSQWRHWGCITPKILGNMKAAHEDPSDLDGYEDLKDEDKAKVVKAWQEGHVDPADVPETQTQPGDEPEKKKRAPRKKKAAEDDGEDEAAAADDAEPAEKPKKGKAKAKVFCAVTVILLIY